MSYPNEFTPLLYFALGVLTVLLLLGLGWLWRRKRGPSQPRDSQAWFSSVRVIEHSRPRAVPERYWLWLNLTPREMEVARLAAHGHRNIDIARFLSLAPSTISGHLKNIYAKLDVHSRTELANLLHELGEYDGPDP